MNYYYSFMGDLKPKLYDMRIIETFAAHKQWSFSLTISSLTLYFAMLWNGQTHFKNLAAFAAGFLKCVWPFHDIAK